MTISVAVANDDSRCLAAVAGQTGRFVKYLAIAVLTAVVVLGVGSTEAAAPPPDPVPVFELWAAAQGMPVDRPACHTDRSNESTFILCYGLAGDDGAGGYAEIVVAFTVTEGDGEIESFLPFQISNLDPSELSPVDDAESSRGVSFGPGAQIVGPDIEAGRYTATVPGSSAICYWERLSGFSGEFGDIITNGTADDGERVIVEIAPSDAGFSSTGCGTWTSLE